jgi:hypothetical protein
MGHSRNFGVHVHTHLFGVHGGFFGVQKGGPISKSTVCDPLGIEPILIKTIQHGPMLSRVLDFKFKAPRSY